LLAQTRAEWTEIQSGPNGHSKVIQDYLIVFFGTRPSKKNSSGSTKIQLCRNNKRVCAFTSHMSAWRMRAVACANTDSTQITFCLASRKLDITLFSLWQFKSMHTTLVLDIMSQVSLPCRRDRERQMSSST
jgi:hypothetical protein